MADWNVNIVQTASGEAEFVIDGGQPGQPLEATQGDLVSWYNKTDGSHQLWQTDEDYNPLGESGLPGLIKPGLSSDAYDVAQPLWGPSSWTVYYYCSLHPDNPKERGSIQVTALPIAINVGDQTDNNGNVIGWSLSTNTMTGSATPLNVAPGQTVYWSNKSSRAHQPWQADPKDPNNPNDPNNPVYVPRRNGPLSGVLQPNSTSAIITPVAPPNNTPAEGGTIYYTCAVHPNNANEQGQIVVQPQGD
jgi:plastocyanin